MGRLERFLAILKKTKFGPNTVFFDLARNSKRTTLVSNAFLQGLGDGKALGRKLSQPCPNFIWKNMKMEEKFPAGK
jgi:hypothetical protein